MGNFCWTKLTTYLREMGRESRNKELIPGVNQYGRSASSSKHQRYFHSKKAVKKQEKKVEVASTKQPRWYRAHLVGRPLQRQARCVLEAIGLWPFAYHWSLQDQRCPAPSCQPGVRHRHVYQGRCRGCWRGLGD